MRIRGFVVGVIVTFIAISMASFTEEVNGFYGLTDKKWPLVFGYYLFCVTWSIIHADGDSGRQFYVWNIKKYFFRILFIVAISFGYVREVSLDLIWVILHTSGIFMLVYIPALDYINDSMYDVRSYYHDDFTHRPSFKGYLFKVLFFLATIPLFIAAS